MANVLFFWVSFEHVFSTFFMSFGIVVWVVNGNVTYYLVVSITNLIVLLIQICESECVKG